MSVRRLCPEQPADFAFSTENEVWAKEIISHYPEEQQASAVILLLWRAQEQHDGWLPEPALRAVADKLGMAYIRVYEVATFYTMFQLSPVGRKAHVQVCGTTPCMLRGSGDLISVCKKRIAREAHQLSEDGDFSWEEVECLGSCANAPMVQIFKDTYEDLTPELFEAVLDGFEHGQPLKPGSQIGRQSSCPLNGATTLTDPRLYADRDGAVVGVAGAAVGAKDSISEGAQPAALQGPRGMKADDLQRIGGVGPRAEKVLNGLGIFHFDQIAEWGPETVAWVDNFLRFKGRIGRENWISQAKVLAAGRETVFSARMATKAKAEAAPENGEGEK